MTVVGLTPGQAMGCFSMRCLRSDGKGGESVCVGPHRLPAAKHCLGGDVAPGMLRLSQAQPSPSTSPAAPHSQNSLILPNVGHNSGHGNEGPRGGGQGSRQPPQQHLGGGKLMVRGQQTWEEKKPALNQH